MTKREKDILIAQLMATHASVEAALAVLVSEEVEGCPHPAESVTDLSTMGGEEKYRCTQCGEESAKPFHTVEA